MRSVRRRHGRLALLAPVVLGLLVAAVVAGCASGSGGATPSPTASATSSAAASQASSPVGVGPLVKVTLRGGLCPAPACDQTVTVERDGRVHAATKPPNDLGVVPAGPLAALDAAIRATDFAAIQSHPNTSQCPTVYDGRETVITFGAPGGPVTIASCDIAIDWGQPVFVALSTALGPFIALPAT